MIVTDATQLHRVDHLIHDRWFSIEDIEYQTEAGTLIILYSNDDSIDRRSLCSVKGQSSVARLTVRNVVSFEIKDSERIVWYDFHRVKFSEKSGRVDVLTNIPLFLRLEVSALHIRVEPCDSGDPVGSIGV